MKNTKPIILIDDDEDDLYIIIDAVKALGIKNEILTFSNGKLALDYLMQLQVVPFFILCDINMPLMDGFELRKKMNSDTLLSLKSTPFIFLTTSQSINEINKAYVLNIQGYFTKPDSVEAFKKILKNIIEYWETSSRPNPLASHS